MYVREQPTRLHLVRHGEVDEAYHQVFGGSIDMELSATGHEQAKGLAKFLQGRNFDHIYRSPMVRVRQTAKPLDGYRSRIRGSLEQMMGEGAGQDVLVLCHGGVIRMLLALLLDEPFSKMDRFEVDFASLTVIEHRSNRAEIKLHNFAPWLWLGENGAA